MYSGLSATSSSKANVAATFVATPTAAADAAVAPVTATFCRYRQ